MLEKSYRKGIVAIILDSEDNFLLVQLQNYGPTDWNFVGGGQEANESYEDTLCRELKEELNITTDQFEIINKSKSPLKYDLPKPIVKDEVLYTGQVKEQYLVRYKGEKEKIMPSEGEIRDYKWVRFEDLENYLKFPGQYENALNVLEELKPELIIKIKN